MNIFAKEIDGQKAVQFLSIGNLKIKKDWLLNTSSEEYKQNVLICTRLAAVIMAEKHNLTNKSNLFKLAHLKAETTTILQQNVQVNIQKIHKIQSNKQWTFTAQKQGTNLLKRVYLRKCQVNFERIIIVSQAKKENIVLDTMGCGYKIQVPNSADNQSVFPWLQSYPCRIILTAPDKRKFAVYVNKLSEAKEIEDEINLRKACQSLKKYNHLIEKSSELFKRKVVVASAQKLNQNGKYREHKRQLEQKEIQQRAQAKRTLAESIVNITTMDSPKNNRVNKLGRPKRKVSEVADSPRKLKPKMSSPTLKVRTRQLQHLQSSFSQLIDIPVSALMRRRNLFTIDSLYKEDQLPSQILQKSKSSEEPEQADPLEDVLTIKVLPDQEDLVPATRKRKMSFYVQEGDNLSQLKQVQMQGSGSGYNSQSDGTIPQIPLDMFITVIGIHTFIRHFEKDICIQLVQLVDPEAESAKFKAIEFRKASLHFQQGPGTPNNFSCKHQSLLFSSCSEKFRIVISLNNNPVAKDIIVKFCKAKPQTVEGQLLYFKDAPFAGFITYILSNRPVAKLQNIGTVEYIRKHATDYQRRYRMIEINRAKSLCTMEFNQNAWEYMNQRQEQDLFQRLVYLGVPDRFKKAFHSCIPPKVQKSTQLSPYQCNVLKKSLPNNMNDALVYTLNAPIDIILQLSAFNCNPIFKERIRVLVEYYQFKTGSSQKLILTLCYTILRKLQPVILESKTKTQLQQKLRIYLQVEYELDQIFEDVYSYMHS